MIGTFCSETLAAVRPDWLQEIRAHAAQAEARRALARYDTGTISEAACVYLRALTERFRPKVAIEIGTFIGTSALAMRADRIYTCDKSNDCGPKEKRIVCHPYTGSTRMLAALVDRGVRADFFFFDGRIKDADEAMILALSTPETVYAFDDYEGREKGVLNVERLTPYLPHHTLVPPPADVLSLPSKTTIAVLVPERRA
jgi:hypothetical protein